MPPWIGYFVEENGNFIGSAGFKGAPINGIVEIAYGTFAGYRKQGIGTAICKKLVELSIDTDPSIKITATTFQKETSRQEYLKKIISFVLEQLTTLRTEKFGNGYIKQVGLLTANKQFPNEVMKYARDHKPLPRTRVLPIVGPTLEQLAAGSLSALVRAEETLLNFRINF